MELIGTVKSIITGMAVIQGMISNVAIDCGSILWTQDRKPYGRVFEVFGTFDGQQNIFFLNIVRYLYYAHMP